MASTESSQVASLITSEESSVTPEKTGPLFYIRFLTFLLFIVIVQTTIAPVITVLGAKPDIALVAVICVALLKGPAWGAAAGFAIGLLVDVALVQTMGISSFLMTLGGYFSGRYAENLDLSSWFPTTFIVFAASLVVKMMFALMMYLIGVEAALSFVLLRIVLPTAVINALLATPVFIISRKWLSIKEPDVLFSK
ncbi:MAG: rod shape-determining protein MreD [Thermoleophilia bacterium]